MGVSIIEAASAGVPTITYEVPGVEDTIENGLNGIKVIDGDKLALLGAASLILRDPLHWWTSSPKEASKYSWDKTAEEWEKLLRSL